MVFFFKIINFFYKRFFLEDDVFDEIIRRLLLYLYRFRLIVLMNINVILSIYIIIIIIL